VLGKTATGWLWVYARPGGGVIFDFQKSRGREGPDTMLKCNRLVLLSITHKFQPSKIQKILKN
jgi:hypothetical protein